MCRVPQRYPFSFACGTGQSRRCGGGSCAGGRETRFCRFESGRSCCRSGRRACPVASTVSVRSVAIVTLLRASSFIGAAVSQVLHEQHEPYFQCQSCNMLPTYSTRRDPLSSSMYSSPLLPRMGCAHSLSALQCHGVVMGAYLSRVDLLAGESVVVGPHVGDVVTAISLCSVAASSPEFVVYTPFDVRLRSVVVGKPAPSPAAHSRNCRPRSAKIPWRLVRAERTRQSRNQLLPVG